MPLQTVAAEFSLSLAFSLSLSLSQDAEAIAQAHALARAELDTSSSARRRHQDAASPSPARLVARTRTTGAAVRVPSSSCTGSALGSPAARRLTGTAGGDGRGGAPRSASRGGASPASFSPQTVTSSRIGGGGGGRFKDSGFSRNDAYGERKARQAASHASTRRRAADKIAKENAAFLRRLEATKPSAAVIDRPFSAGRGHRSHHHPARSPSSSAPSPSPRDKSTATAAGSHPPMRFK